ncbi:hypothetical protein GQ457_09G013790 [Hibiscus cannabinus]
MFWVLGNHFPESAYLTDDFPNTDLTVKISLSLFAVADTDQHADCNDKSSINNDQLLLEFRDENNSLDQVLRKIEIVHAKVPKLRNQLDQVMSKNVSKFSSSENLSLLAACDAQTSSSPSPTFLAGNGDTTSADLYLTQLNKFANMLEIRSCLQIVENVLIQNDGNAGDKQALMATNIQSVKQHHHGI